MKLKVGDIRYRYDVNVYAGALIVERNVYQVRSIRNGYAYLIRRCLATGAFSEACGKWVWNKTRNLSPWRVRVEPKHWSRDDRFGRTPDEAFRKIYGHAVRSEKE